MRAREDELNQNIFVHCNIPFVLRKQNWEDFILGSFLIVSKRLFHSRLLNK